MSADQPSQTDPAASRALDLLRSSTTATLICDSIPTTVEYLLDPAGGGLILCADHSMLDAEDCVLAVPEDRFDCPLRVSLSLSQEPEGTSTDRYFAYHLSQNRPIWTRGTIEFAKIDSGEVIDGRALMQPCVLRDEIPRLCRLLNNDQHALGELCLLLTKARVEDPVAVGVDDRGCDVRCAFGVLRVPWPSPVTEAETCEHVIAALIGGVV